MRKAHDDVRPSSSRRAIEPNTAEDLTRCAARWAGRLVPKRFQRDKQPIRVQVIHTTSQRERRPAVRYRVGDADLKCKALAPQLGNEQSSPTSRNAPACGLKITSCKIGDSYSGITLVSKTNDRCSIRRSPAISIHRWPSRLGTGLQNLIGLVRIQLGGPFQMLPLVETGQDASL